MVNKTSSTREIVGVLLACTMCSIAFPDDLVFALVPAAAAAWCVFLPVLVFMHELGHAVAATVGTAESVHVTIRNERFPASFRLGRINVHFGRGSTAGCLWAGGTARRTVAVALAGPLVDLAFGVASVLLAVEIGGPPVMVLTAAFAGAISLLSALVNLSPRHLPGFRGDTPTDGARALRAFRDMRGMAHPELDAPPLVPELDRLVRFAGKAAMSRSCEHVGTDHLLLGMTRMDGPAAAVLRDAGITAKSVEAAMDATQQCVRPPTAELAFTPAARRALAPGGARIGLERVLLSLVEETDTLAMDVLVHLGIDITELRLRVSALLGMDTLGSAASPQAALARRGVA